MHDAENGIRPESSTGSTLLIPYRQAEENVVYALHRHSNLSFGFNSPKECSGTTDVQARQLVRNDGHTNCLGIAVPLENPKFSV